MDLMVDYKNSNRIHDFSQDYGVQYMVDVVTMMVKLLYQICPVILLWIRLNYIYFVMSEFFRRNLDHLRHYQRTIF
jgi:hypothetical protein